MLWISWGPIANSWSILETSPDPGGLPRYPIKTVILVSFFLLLLQAFSQIVKNVGDPGGNRREDPPRGSPKDPPEVHPPAAGGLGPLREGD